MGLLHTERIGECGYNLSNTPMQIITYNNSNDIYVKFLDKYGYITHTTYNSFIHHNVKNPYEPTVFGHGFIGSGKYKGGKKGSKAYNYWYSMLRRCYSDNYISKTPSYKDCYVCDEWLNYQAFGEWFDKHYYETSDYKMNLDKDILIKSNRMYSPKACCFVPNNINMLFRPEDFTCKNGHLPGTKPIKNSKKHKFEANIKINGVDTYIGTFNTEYEAFLAYKNAKEKIIKETAEKYKGIIPDNVYQSMVSFTLEVKR